jgi:hypothetical protein
LCTATSAPAQGELEDRIESWLARAFGVDVGFKVGEALAKLDRVGLLKRDGEQLSVLPPDAALRKLDRVWGDFFRPRPTAAGAS